MDALLRIFILRNVWFLVALMVYAPVSYAISHQNWSGILSKYVTPDARGIHRVDYAALKEDTHAQAVLNAYIDQYKAAGLDTLSRPAQFVAWINLYNALTVKVIVEHYPVKSIRQIGSGIFSVGPWRHEKVNVDGQEISLHDIEHEILRKEWDEPRVHYALNCASIGCPNLKLSAWQVEGLEADLQQAAAAFINHPRGVSFTPNGKIQVSSIYKWFRADFGANEASVLAHIAMHASPDLKEKLAGHTKIGRYEYDWSLNDIEQLVCKTGMDSMPSKEC